MNVKKNLRHYNTFGSPTTLVSPRELQRHEQDSDKDKYRWTSF